MNVDMVKRICRGSVIGIFLGVCGGIIFAYVFRIKELAEKRNNSLEQIGDNMVVEANVEESAYGPECTNLQDVILRFHVTANSNSDEDMGLKFSVRDAILYEFGDIMQSDMSREQVISYLEDNLDRIQEVAELTLYNLGYSYPVKVYISNDYFPIRQYGEMVFPAGYYDALRVDIGNAQGENFWCVLYPMMCYPLDAGAVLSKEDGEVLREVLSEEDYEKLFIDRDESKDINIKFKFLEWFGL